MAANQTSGNTKIIHAGEPMPLHNWRDRLNEFRLDLKFRWVPFRGYYRYRAHKYRDRIDPELGLLKFLIDRTRNSVDIGANLGLVTFFLARYSLHVHAFEPNPLPLRSLRMIADNNVTVRQIALTDRSGEVDLVVPRSRKGWSSNGASLATTAGGADITVRVPGARLDDLDLGPIGFIKIDVEGHERAVLEGARATLARDRPNLMVECEHAHVGERMDSVFGLLDSLGYDGYFLDNGVLKPLSQFSVETHQLGPRRGEPGHAYVKNFFFIDR